MATTTHAYIVPTLAAAQQHKRRMERTHLRPAVICQTAGGYSVKLASVVRKPFGGR